MHRGSRSGTREGGAGGRVFPGDPLEWHDVAGHRDATSGGTRVQIWAQPATLRSVHPQLGVSTAPGWSLSRAGATNKLRVLDRVCLPVCNTNSRGSTGGSARRSLCTSARSGCPVRACIVFVPESAPRALGDKSTARLSGRHGARLALRAPGSLCLDRGHTGSEGLSPLGAHREGFVFLEHVLILLSCSLTGTSCAPLRDQTAPHRQPTARGPGRRGSPPLVPMTSCRTGDGRPSPDCLSVCLTGRPSDCIATALLPVRAAEQGRGLCLQGPI